MAWRPDAEVGRLRARLSPLLDLHRRASVCRSAPATDAVALERARGSPVGEARDSGLARASDHARALEGSLDAAHDARYGARPLGRGRTVSHQRSVAVARGCGLS